MSLDPLGNSLLLLKGGMGILKNIKIALKSDSWTIICGYFE